MLVVDLADPTATLTTGPDWAGAKVVRADGHRRWIRFACDQISAARLVTLVLDRHQVIDLSIVEPDIEDVIRRIYRGEIPPATDG
jgi:viologen exporter family transport system ATP-binding protein